MTPEEEIEIEAEARARARMRMQQQKEAPSNVGPPGQPEDSMVARPFDGQSPQTTQDTSLWGKALNWITDQSMVPPVGDENRNLVYPKASQQDVAVTQDMAKEAASTAAIVGGSMIAPAMLPTKLGPAADLVGRGAQYALKAGESALGAYLGKKGSQAVGIMSPTTGQEDLDQAMIDVAVGGGLPTALDAVGTGISKLGSSLNSNERIARMFGAKDAQFNPRKNSELITDNVDYLRKNSPEFVQNQIANPSIQDASAKALARLDEVGGQIRGVYSQNQGLLADVSDVQANPGYMKLVNAAFDASKTPAEQVVAKNALAQINGPVGAVAQMNGGKLPLANLWETRKSLDGLISNFNEADPNLRIEHLLTARTALQDVINSTIAKVGNPQLAKELGQLNAEYSNLSDVADILAKKASQSVGKSVIDSTLPTTSLKGLTGNYFGLGSNAGRAAVYNAGNGVSPDIATLTSGATELSSLIPRETNAIHSSSDHTNSVINLARQFGLVASPDQYARMPTPLKNMVVSQLSNMSPQSFAVSPDNVNSINGKYQNPMEKDAIVQQYLDADPETRAMIVGASFQNKHVAPPQQKVPKPPQPALPSVMERVNRWSQEPMPPSSHELASPDLVAQLDNLTQSKLLHAQDN